MKQTIIFILTLVLNSGLIYAQHYCGTDKVFNQLQMDEVTYQRYQEKIKELSLRDKQIQREQVYIIPVVFHIIHKGGIENIADEQVLDQVRIINEDFRKLSAKVDEIIPEFQGIAADSKIEFRLAKTDPQGNCTNGILRHYDERTYSSDLHDADSLKIGRQWPRDMYLNIYVLGSIETSGGGTTLGFAYYPVTVDEEKQVFDGIMQVYSSVGSFGTSSDRYSGVLTHEIGHYFHLHHTWGQGTAGTSAACLEDDDVEDTPNTKGNPSVCVLNKESCGSLDNVQNFMDYSFCYAMLTEGQRVRMTAVLNDTIADRDKLWQPSNLLLTGAADEYPGVLCDVNFKVENNHNCIEQNFTFKDLSYHNVQNRYWHFPNANLEFLRDSNQVEITYPIPGIFDVSLAVSNDVDSLNIGKQKVVYVHNAPGVNFPHVQTFSSVDSLEELIWVSPINEFQLTNVGTNDLKSLMINNFEAANGTYSTIETSTFDLSNQSDVELHFDVAFATQKSTTADKLEVYVTDDCVGTWTKITTFQYYHLLTGPLQSGAPFVPDTSQWKNKTVSIPANFYSTTTRFKLVFFKINGNNFYLDNFELKVNPLAGIDEKQGSNVNWLHSSQAWKMSNDAPVKWSKVYDLQGRLIIQSSQERIIRHDGLNPGIYVITWESENQLYQQKVVKH